MRNFILLIRRYNFFIVFLLLQGVCIFLLVQNNTYQRAVFITTSNTVVGTLYSAYSSVTDYLKLGITNQILAEENARLRQTDSSSFYIASAELVKVKDSVEIQQYEYITARVINNSVNRVDNYITLDKGSLQGINPDDAVISSNGVVGIVRHVSPHFSTVTSLLHSGSRISSKIKKNEFFGTTVWDGKDPEYGQLIDIPSHAQVEVGDSIVTNTYSDIFPRGILVGTVAEIGTSGQSFKKIKVHFATGFQNLSYVYVVRNLLKTERDSLEEKTLLNAR